MLTALRQERLVGKILSASLETVNLEDFGLQVLPLLERLFDTSASLFYRCDGPTPLTAISGTLIESCPEYGRDYYAIDPLHDEERRLNPRITFIPRLPIWKPYLQSAAYGFMHRRDADYLVHLRLTETDYHAPGMVGLLLTRSCRQPDFGKDEEAMLEQVFGTLSAAAQRSLRLEEKLGLGPVFEAMLDTKGRGEIALTLEGRLLWASKTAHDWLGLRRGGRENVPPALVEAARRLVDLTHRPFSSAAASTSLTIPHEGAPVQAELRLARTREGQCFVRIELKNGADPARLTGKISHFDLTSAEIKVLSLLAQGLSDREIGRRLFISHHTVRTHVARILSKLDVHSRLQAALLVLSETPGNF